MKICVVQIKPVKGDVQANIANHKKLLNLAVAHGAETIVFPELSITGYEPELAKELATDQNDERFDDFQLLADARGVTIGIGVPTKNGEGVSISLALFQPQQTRQLYSKKYLHSDEEPFFVSGENSNCLLDTDARIALAICYETNVAEHAENAFQNEAKVYLASVAKTAEGVARSEKRLPEIAAKYSMAVLMSNCVGPCDNFLSAGKSAVWNDQGELLGQLDDVSEGIIIFDTETGETIIKTIAEPEFSSISSGA